MPKPQQPKPQQQRHPPPSSRSGDNESYYDDDEDDDAWSDDAESQMRGLPQPGAPSTKDMAHGPPGRPPNGPGRPPGAGSGGGPPPRGGGQNAGRGPPSDYDDEDGSEGPYSDEEGEGPYGDEDMGSQDPRAGGPGGPPRGPMDDPEAMSEYGGRGPPPPPDRSMLGKSMRIASIVTSLIGIVLLMVLLIQDVTTFLNKDNIGIAAAATASAKPKSKPKPQDDEDETNTLLGRGLPAVALPLHRMVRRSAIYRRAGENANATVTAAAQYVANTDIPVRSAAVGFVVATHFFHATVLLGLIYIDFRAFKGKSFILAPWDSAVIGLVQFLLAFDVLSRRVSKIIEIEAYFFLLFAILNLGWGVWSGIKAKKMQSMGGDGYDDDYPPEDGSMQDGPGRRPPGGEEDYGDKGSMMDEDGMPPGPGGPPGGREMPPGMMPPGQQKGAKGGLAPPDDMSEDYDEKSLAPTDATDDHTIDEKPLKKSKHSGGRGGKSRKAPSIASSWVTQDTDDIDSYYERPHSKHRKDRHRSPPRRPEPAYHPHPSSRSESRSDTIDEPPSPISLYDPKALRKKEERQKRARSRSLTQQPGPPPTATRFRDRVMTAVQEEPEDDDDDITYKADPARLANDGFAQRAKDQRNLRRLYRQS